MKQFHFDTYNFLRHGANRINRSWLDSATDLAETSFANGGTRTSFNIGNYYGSAGAPELSDTWESFYRGIRKCNMIITRINDVPKDADLSETQYEQDKLNYTSEARFLRAYFYWELFLRYGAIPIVTEVLDPDGDLLSGYTTRPSVKEYVVDFILKELKECEPGLMTYTDAWDASRAGRIGQPMARAFTRASCSIWPAHAIVPKAHHLATSSRCGTKLHQRLWKQLQPDDQRHHPRRAVYQCLVTERLSGIQQGSDILPQRRGHRLG